MKLISRIIIFSLMFFSFIGHAHSKPEQKTLIVGVLPDFQPQYLRQFNGRAGGFAVDTFDQIALRAGIDYRYRFLENWDQMLTSLRIGEIDIIPNLGVTPERLKLFAFSQTIEQFDIGLFVPTAIKGVANIEAMSGKRVAVVKRNAGVKLIKRYPTIESREYKHVEQALFALLAGDVDGLVYPVPVVSGLIKRHKLEDKIKQTGSLILRVSRSLAVRKDNRELLEQRLNKAVADFVESPEYRSIYLRWHEEGELPQVAPSEPHGLLGAEDISLILIFVAVAALLLYFRQAPGISRLLPADFSKAVTVLLLMVIVLVFVVSTVITEPQDNLKPNPKIAVIHLSKVDSSTYAGFLVKMKELGYQQGRNVEYIYKGAAGSIDRLDGLIHEHLAMEPDLVLVSSTPGTLAVKRLTEGSDIPIVFAPVNDPLDAGIVADLQHPEGLITGVRLPTGDDLRLQWLGQIAPNVHKVYVPYTDGDRSALATIRQIEKVASQLGMELVIRPLAGDEEIFGDGSLLAKDIDAIFLPRDSTIEARIDEFVALAKRYQLPLSAPSEKQVASGALFTFGFVHYEIGRQAGQLIDQILRGTPPTELPILMAENHLLINLKAARQIGLTIPSGVLRQANRLIRE